MLLEENFFSDGCRPPKEHDAGDRAKLANQLKECKSVMHVAKLLKSNRSRLERKGDNVYKRCVKTVKKLKAEMESLVGTEKKRRFKDTKLLLAKYLD